MERRGGSRYRDKYDDDTIDWQDERQVRELFPDDVPEKRKLRRKPKEEPERKPEGRSGGLFHHESRVREKPVSERRVQKNERRVQEPDRQPAQKVAESPLADLFLLLFKMALIALFVVILFTFVFGITQVRDNSMAPSICEGDLVIYYRFQKDYTSQNVIALKVDGKTQVRRVIGTEGDEINISEKGLEINGYPQIEDKIYRDTLPYVTGVTFPITLGKNQVFVLGDNRTDANDSRMYGAVDRGATLGTVVTVIRRRGF